MECCKANREWNEKGNAEVNTDGGDCSESAKSAKAQGPAGGTRVERWEIEHERVMEGQGLRSDTARCKDRLRWLQSNGAPEEEVGKAEKAMMKKAKKMRQHMRGLTDDKLVAKIQQTRKKH